MQVLFGGECIAIGSFLVYLATLAPGVYGFDSAELASGVYSLGIVHPPGFPLYMLLGKLFTFLPLGSVAYRLNLMSAFFAALTIYVLYKVIFSITAKKWAAWVSSAFLAFSIYFWQMSVVTEVYTLHTFFLVFEIFILLKWRETGKHATLIFFAFVYGLSLTNHTTGLLFAPGFAWMILSSPGWKWKIEWFWAAMIGSFLAALLLYLYIPIRANSTTSLNYLKEYYSMDVTTLSGLLWMVSGKAYHFFAFGYATSEIWHELVDGIRLLWRNFMGVGFLMGVLGVFTSCKKNWKIGMGCLLLFLGNFIFYVNYRVLDKDTMFLPAFTVFAVWIGFGLSFLDDLLGKLFTEIDFKKGVQFAHPVFWVSLIFMTVFLNWRWTDMSQMLGPETFSNTILDSATDGATIIASWSPAVVLEYYQIVEGRRTDLTIYNQSRSEVARYYQYWSSGKSSAQIASAVNHDELAAVNKMYENNIVYSIEYDPVIANSYEYLPVGTFYKLEKRNKD